MAEGSFESPGCRLAGFGRQGDWLQQQRPPRALGRGNSPGGGTSGAPAQHPLGGVAGEDRVPS